MTRILFFLWVVLISRSRPVFCQEIANLKDLGEKGGAVEVTVPPEIHFNRGEKICFGVSKDRQIGCGKIFKISDAAVFVRVTASTFTKLRKNHVAFFANEVSAQSGQNQSTVNSVIRLLYSPFLVGPTGYNSVTYAAPTLAESNTPADTQYWIKDTPVTMSLITATMEYGRFLGPKSAWLLALRYRSNQESSVLADYVAGVSTTYLTIKDRLTGIALSSDYAFYASNIGNGTNVFFATGIEIENTVLTFDATRTDDSIGLTESIASLKSQMMTASLRFRPGFDWNFSRIIGLHTGITLLLPLTKFASTSIVSVTDSHSADKKIASDDLQNALAHRPSRYAVGFDLGFIAKF